jgi:hypothetical protein
VVRLLYDNMKTVVLERDVDGEGEHRYHAGFLDYARHCGFVIKLCRPYRARTKGKVERFNGYLRRSFYVPLVAQLKQAGLPLDAVTANAEVRRWLKEVANVRVHGSTQAQPAQRLQRRAGASAGIAPPWRGDIAAARPAGAPPSPVEGALSARRLPRESRCPRRPASAGRLRATADPTAGRCGDAAHEPPIRTNARHCATP